MIGLGAVKKTNFQVTEEIDNQSNGTFFQALAEVASNLITSLCDYSIYTISFKIKSQEKLYKMFKQTIY